MYTDYDAAIRRAEQMRCWGVYTVRILVYVQISLFSYRCLYRPVIF